MHTRSRSSRGATTHDRVVGSRPSSRGWWHGRGRRLIYSRSSLRRAAAGEAADVALDAGRGAHGRLVGARGRARRGAAHRLGHAPRRALQDDPLVVAPGVRVELACLSVSGGGGHEEGRGDEEEEERGEDDGRGIPHGGGTGRGHDLSGLCWLFSGVLVFVLDPAMTKHSVAQEGVKLK